MQNQSERPDRGTLIACVDWFLSHKEKNHGTKIFEEGIIEGRARNAGAQTRDSEKRPFGQEGDEPQAGDCNRSLRGESRGTESPEKDGKQKSHGRHETEVEEVGTNPSCRHGRA